ncbi:MAG TPA: acetoin utilization protein AcuC [Actinomycetota bacterium]|nr:acetoin utilization protein AcuC [Actinomycetota bacterium]
MSGLSSLVLCREARIYDHGPQHPLRPERVQLTWDLIEALGLPSRPQVRTLGCRTATDEELLLVHTPEYLDATRRAGDGEEGDFRRFGYGPGDNPVFPRMHEAAALVAGATLAAAAAIVDGEVDHAFNAAGGLHHAMPSRASGFCVYDDPAIAIAWLLDHGVERIAYVDVDVHHGDGPQAIFYDDPRVLTISIHESGDYLFPGTGTIDERGAGEAEGTKVNVPLEPSTGDDGWLGAFRAVVPPLVRAWRPDVLVTQLGCDTHHTDPLAHLRLTTRAYREAAGELHELAHDAAGGRWLATGGGGYQWARVVPRAWTLYFAEMIEAELPEQLPESWIEQVEFALRAPVPETFDEPEPSHVAPADNARRVAAVVRRSAFPALGLPA